MYYELLFSILLVNRDVGETIENVWLQVKSAIVSKMQEKDQILTAESENTLKDQIISLSNKEAPVRKLMWRRLIAYVRLVKTNKTLPPVPPGYNDISDELQTLANTFKRLTVYNYSVFGEHCEKILDEISKPITKVADTTSPSDSTGNSTENA